MRSNVRLRISVVLVLAVILFSLGYAAMSHYQKRKMLAADLGDKTVEVPEFSIAVQLSPAAEKRLRDMGESVLVIAYFDGDPLAGQGTYNAPFRDIYLGEDEKLVDATNVAKFDTTKISSSNWKRLADKNYFVTINVVSARKKAKNNLLDGGVLEDRISTFAGKTTEVRCWLIGESDAPTK